MNGIYVFASCFVLALVCSAGAQQPTNSTVTPSNSTTAAPTTSTVAPTATTTPAAKNTTATTPATNTTTAVPTTSTSTAPPTTTPKETKNTYNVSQDGVQCIRMEAKIDFSIKYDKKKVTDKVAQKVIVPMQFAVDGDCGNKTETLKITFYKDWVLQYTFEKKGDNYHVSNISLDYVLDENFPDAVKAGAKMNVTISGKNDFMKANSDGYVCSSKIGKDSGDVTINTEKLKYKAFNKKGDIDFSKSALECSADEDTNSIVPIAVGAALAGLVVIVLIAYLIGRKRTRKTGYESV